MIGVPMHDGRLRRLEVQPRRSVRAKVRDFSAMDETLLRCRAAVAQALEGK